ncbi:MAG TPA: hypothetical protein VGR03_14400 [Candidatus Acidoferrum sp.]|nr:hypothetical protein [Candidatus Acidoferrum sp.]
MSEFTPHLAPVVALLFFGTILLIGASFLVLFYGTLRRSSFFAKLGAGAAFATAAGYLILLTSVSVASSERVLPPGGWKAFCEIDCHIWYSVAGMQVATALGREMQQTTANGQFVIARLKTWFNENTISPHRGNRPLVPGPRRVVLVDDSGRSYDVSSEGQAALAALGDSSLPLDQALRPGESFTTDLVFDIPKTARGLRLLIADDDPATRFVIGHENSLLHKKIYFGVESAPPLTKAAR